MITVGDMTVFLVGRLPNYRGWTLASIAGMVRWHLDRGGVHAVVCDGRLFGLALGRPVRRRCDVNRRWAWNARGRWLCVDVAAGDVPVAMRALWGGAARRWGAMDGVVFKRWKQGAKMKIYNFSKFERRLCHG